MKETSPYELPKASEKLSYKFILDALKEKQLAQIREPQPLELEAVTPAPPEPEEPSAAPLDAVLSAEEMPSTELNFPSLNLPREKNYFRIGEVAELVGVEPYVLRYWEGEFRMKPSKSGSGHRVYSRKEVETFFRIRHLLHVEKFSIKGAKQKLLELKKTAASPAPEASQRNQETHKTLKALAQELKQLIQAARTANPGNW